MTDINSVALSKLDADPRNVRKTYSAGGIEALTANIRADGYRLSQNLVVRRGDKKAGISWSPAAADRCAQAVG
ncbi:hypothetical protein [Sinorhizobium medicae]|uniref:hypothetical protein n=1 Tax=Sinorhizobium medicae TaxID=110321 RepID=UPI001F45E0C2|nr:hypothetical protein [Sinorhizobium medicae]